MNTNFNVDSVVSVISNDGLKAFQGTVIKVEKFKGGNGSEENVNFNFVYIKDLNGYTTHVYREDIVEEVVDNDIARVCVVNNIPFTKALVDKVKEVWFDARLKAHNLLYFKFVDLIVLNTYHFNL